MAPFETWFWPHPFDTPSDYNCFAEENSRALFEQAYQGHHQVGRGVIVMERVGSDFLRTTYRALTAEDVVGFSSNSLGTTPIETLNEYDPSQEMLMVVMLGPVDAWLGRAKVILASHN